VQQYIWDCTTGSTAQSYLYSANRELVVGGKCLGAAGNRTTNGTGIITWDCNSSNSQKWTFHPDGSVTNDLSGLCLDVTSQGTTNGSLVQLWSCTGNSNQKWTAKGNT
jgi:glucosylceramidase